MDLALFANNQQENSIIQKDADPDKYATIVAKLCAKRKNLELSLNNTDLTSEAREESALSLLQLKSSMATFGVSEIDYHAYLAKEEQGDQQLPLFS